ncbi:MAG: glycosyltransferase family 2 protein [Candidatus Geothermincolia bacterium]
MSEKLPDGTGVKKEPAGPRTVAVLVNWNSGEYTVPCIESLLNGQIAPDKIVVVDNGSSDGSADLIANRFPFVDVIRNKENRGFASGNNQGITRAMSDGADFIWVLNNDTVVAEDCLKVLLRACEAFPRGGCFSGKIYLGESKDMIWFAGSHRHKIHLGPIHEGEGKPDIYANDVTVAVPFLSGCCMLFPRWALERLGLFIEDYFCYSEDNEWSWRAISSGVDLIYVPAANVWHHVSASAIKNDPSYRPGSPPAGSWYFMVRNHLWTIRRWARPPGRKYFALASNIAIELRMTVGHLLRADTSRAKAIARGMIDGVIKPIPGSESRQ